MARQPRYDMGGNLTAYGQQQVQAQRDRTPVTPQRIAKAHADALRFERRCSIWEMERIDDEMLQNAH
jgi:hypothetical protein